MLIAGRYRLLDLVGRGGMGRVWRARDEMLHREVAVKEIVPPSWLADPERAELRARTLREARAAARLNHPAVVRLYDVIPVDGSPWIVMEYVPSRTLQDLVDAEGPLQPAHAARIGLAVLDALQAAHTAGVLHRDIKPQNVLVAHDGRVMLTDFGLATFDGGDGATTRPGMVLGSPQYVAPERAAEGVSTVTADLWSLGATLHAAVEGRSPYARSTAMATLSALAAGPPDPAPHAGSLAPVLAGLLRRDPRDRLDHDTARRLLTTAATGRTDPPSTTDHLDPPPATGQLDPAAADGPTVADDLANQDITIPLPEPGQAADPAGPAPALPRPGAPRSARRVALVAVALLVAAAAGVGTALAVTADRPTGTADNPTGTATRPTAPPPYGGGQDGPFGPGPDRHRPPRGGPGMPPPPFPCVRPDVVGAPVSAGTPPPNEELRLPSGWVWHADTAGFRVTVPATWRYSRDGRAACFQDPATGRAFSVAEGGAADPLVRLRTARDAAAGAGALPGYDEILLSASNRGAEWECRWRAPDGPWLHARQLVVGTDRWTLGWITDDADWASADADWAKVRESFRAPH
ncbi:tRNA A-37 threonylcarbamoyl transferase component Bud32 [Micromonospora luteifusca]|uniref:non-specific serine/threonine protein kinase n=1 Tax=Micromonospora luteifusca TaxID=709860 RepID=A0ABS2LN98_9ACTN|nr:serine/threonine-protein kinase [Micromonospora luteifusca]MBM7489661.1 tRNA A-37 threonylcarbamoyl transferase component Bud32 [Micromonospora luteifusca]